MRKRIVLLLVVLLALGAQQAFAQMSDSQIVSYITAGVAAGKTETQIATELMAKGVTTSQLQRLMKAYKSGNLNMSDASEVPSNKLGTTTRERKTTTTEDELPAMPDMNMPDGTKPGKFKKKPVDTELAEMEEETEEEADPLYDEDGNKRIYGHNIFSSKFLRSEEHTS